MTTTENELYITLQFNNKNFVKKNTRRIVT